MVRLRPLSPPLLLAALLWPLALACSSDPPRGSGGGRGGERAAKKAEARETTPAPRPSAEPEQVTFATSDGVTLAATLRRGGDPAVPAVVLVHQISSSREEWAPIMAKLAEAPGLTLLAIDLRGHGGSTAGPEGRTLAWRDFTNDEWSSTMRDVIAAVQWLKQHETLRPAKIGLVGSSIGSTAVIAAAAEEESVGAVVAISPGRAYHGFDAYTPVARLRGRPFLAIASENEAPAVETATAMGRITQGETQLYPGEAHGVAILAGSPQMADRVEGFLRRALEAPRP